MDKENEKKANSPCAPYAGSGKLTDYKEEGSWMMNQMSKGYDKCDRGIRIDDSDPSHKRFAKVNRIAAELAVSMFAVDPDSTVYGVSKNYSVIGADTEGNCCALVKYCLSGTMDCVPFVCFEKLAELLYANADCDIFAFDNCGFTVKCDMVKVDFKNACIYLELALCGNVSQDEMEKSLQSLGFSPVVVQEIQ